MKTVGPFLLYNIPSKQASIEFFLNKNLHPGCKFQEKKCVLSINGCGFFVLGHVSEPSDNPLCGVLHRSNSLWRIPFCRYLENDVNPWKNPSTMHSTRLFRCGEYCSANSSKTAGKNRLESCLPTQNVVLRLQVYSELKSVGLKKSCRDHSKHARIDFFRLKSCIQDAILEKIVRFWGQWSWFISGCSCIKNFA